MSVTIVIVNEHAAIREGLALLLEASGVTVSGSTGDLENALDLVESKDPDVILIDVNPEEYSAQGLVGSLFDQDPQPKLLLFCDGCKVSVVQDCIGLGAKNVVSKMAGKDELLKAIKLVAEGKTYTDRRFTGVSSNGSGRLTEREREILALLADGLSGAEVAKNLWLSPETVRTHVRNAMGKLGAKTRVHAVSMAIGSGQIPPPN